MLVDFMDISTKSIEIYVVVWYIFSFYIYWECHHPN